MKTYRETLTLRTRDCDFKGEWRLSAMLESLQEAAGGHCDRLGCGRSALRKKGIAWVLLRNELRMARYPVIDEQVSIETFHTPTRYRMFPRYFILRDAEEKVVGTASSLWVLMDLQSRQSIIPDELASLLPDNSDMQPPMPLPGRIMPIANGSDTEILYHPSYTDLDANGHMNNARYADVLCNCLGVDMFRRHQVESITVNYFAEVLPEHQLHLTLSQDQLQNRLVGTCEGKIAFDLGCRMKPENHISTNK